jgi:drug/metabolite transporter (DMT)-like permease
MQTMDAKTRGWANGMTAVAMFAGSMPATRLAIVGIAPLLLTSARALIAGLIGGALLLLGRQPLPQGRQWRALAVVAGGCVLGFPLLSALALQHISAARSLVFTGLLPLSTATFGVLRGKERPAPAFWAFAAVGAAAVAGFALSRGAPGSAAGDALMLAAVIVCGLGYAEGAVLTRALGGWQVICWALVLCLPAALAATLALDPAAGLAAVGWQSWAGLAYVSLISMLVGFIFWYRGLDLGGIASVGQLQLLQPFLGLGLAALVLGETISPAALPVMALVAASALGARRFA